MLFSDRNDSEWNKTELGGVIWPDRTIYYNRAVYSITIFLCILAMIANVINIVVLTRPEMRCSLNFLLTSLAVSDFVFACVKVSRSVVYFSQPTIQDFVTNMSLLWIYGLYPVENTTALLSEWLNITIGFWRFVAITWPLRARSWCTLPRAKVTVVIIFVSALLVVIPCSFNYRIRAQSLDGIEVKGLDIRPMTGTEYIIFHCVFTWLMTSLFILPIIFLVVITGALIRNMRLALKERRDLTPIMAERNIRKNKMTLTLTIILIVFILTNTPTALFAALYLVPLYSLTDFRNYFFLLQILDRTTTFTSFFLMSSNYRKTLKSVFVKGSPLSNIHHRPSERTQSILTLS